MSIDIIHPIDRSLKILAREYPEELAKFILQDIPLLNVVTIENPELNIPEKRTDFVYVINNKYIFTFRISINSRFGYT